MFHQSSQQKYWRNGKYFIHCTLYYQHTALRGLVIHFKVNPDLIMAWVEFLCMFSLCSCRLPPGSPVSALTLPLGVCKCVNVCVGAWCPVVNCHLIQSVFPPRAQYSWDRLHIQYDPDQQKNVQLRCPNSFGVYTQHLTRVHGVQFHL